MLVFQSTEFVQLISSLLVLSPCQHQGFDLPSVSQVIGLRNSLSYILNSDIANMRLQMIDYIQDLGFFGGGVAESVNSGKVSIYYLIITIF